MNVDLGAAVRRAGFHESEHLRVGVDVSGATLQSRQPGHAGEQVYCASIGKQLTAACVALLVRRGLIAPDHRVSQWVPALPAWADEVTLTQLLHHTSGLPAHASTFDPLGREAWTNDVAMSFLRTAELEAAPGARYGYSGLGYVLLAEVLQRASGQPLPELAAGLVFRPLGMDRSCFWSGPQPQPPGASPLPRPEPAPLSVGDGGLWSTVPDLLRWGAACYQDTLAITELLTLLHPLADGTPQDYAWGVRRLTLDGAECWSHGGSWPGVTSKLIWVPSARLAIAVVSAGDAERTSSLASDLLQQALAAA